MPEYPYISASELGEYVYCKRAWWLKFKGYSKQNSQMVEGIKSHDRLYKSSIFFTIKKILLLIVLITIILIALLILYNLNNA